MSKRGIPTIQTVKDYELMKSMCSDLLEDGTLRVKDIASIIDYLKEFREGWSNEKQSEEKEKKKAKDGKKKKNAKDNEWADMKKYSEASSPKSEIDYPDNQSSASSSHESDDSLNSSSSKLMLDFLDPDVENRELTDEEIQAVNTELQLIVQYGDNTHKFGLLSLLMEKNAKFKECISESDESKRRKQ